MFKYRAISFPILIALLAIMIVYPSWGKYLFAAVAGLATGMMFYEAAHMLENIKLPSYKRFTAYAAGILLTSYLLFNAFTQDRLSFSIAFWLLTLTLVCALLLIYHGWMRMLVCRDKKAALQKTLVSAGLLVICGIPIFALATIYFGRGLGPLALFYVMMVTKSMDTGGYIFGMLSAKLMPGGNHKIVPSISPKKSWEGTIGGILFTVGVALLFYWFFLALLQGQINIPSLYRAEDFPFRLPFLFTAPIYWHITAGVVLAIGSFAGDLSESALKRACNTKDSGHWIPGMGGAFDVLDSFIYNGILFWLLVTFLR